LKVARTIANLAGAKKISGDHISEAVQFRSLDRQLWGCFFPSLPVQLKRRAKE
jgi:hypothetical protein